MWLEIKLVISGIGIIFIAVVLSQIIMLNTLLGFLLIMAIGLVLISDMMLASKIKSSKANFWYERPPPGKELIVIKTLTGLLDLVWATKKPEGQREFVYNKQEASVINTGKDPIHTLAGARGCIAHESLDMNIDTFEAEAVNNWAREYDTDNIKEIYTKAKDREGGY